MRHSDEQISASLDVQSPLGSAEQAEKQREIDESKRLAAERSHRARRNARAVELLNEAAALNSLADAQRPLSEQSQTVSKTQALADPTENYTNEQKEEYEEALRIDAMRRD